MAAIAIPLLAIGSMYVISNQKKNEPKPLNAEGFTNMTATRNPLPGVNPPVTPRNFPTTAPVTRDTNTNAYLNPNQTTDKYYDPANYYKVDEGNAPKYGVGGGTQQVYSLTGAPIDKQQFTHGNMTPFFGGKVRGASTDRAISESVLDNMQGSGSQFFSKTEQAPLFKPQEGFQYANGAPNMSDFMQSRVNPSLRMANVKPWEEQRVAPGLNKGFSNGGGAGFNSGMEAREAWLDRGVDELRVATNPKTTFELRGHEGPGNSSIKTAPTQLTQGKVEKHLPEKYYASGPERWLTTTGLEKAQTARGIELLHDVNRTSTTAEYYGSRANGSLGTYVEQELEPIKRQILPTKDYAPPSATGLGAPTTGDYGMQSYNNLPNNRSTTRADTNMGQVSGLVKSMMSPLMDFLRPTRKEDVVNSLRTSGNPTAPVPTGGIYNPADRTRTTIREMTEADLDCNHLNIEKQAGNAYLVSRQQPVNVQRDTTNMSHTGVAGPNGFTSAKSYEAEYNQHNNVNKTSPNRPNQGGTQMFNQVDNISISKRDADRDNNRWWVPSAGGTAGYTAGGATPNMSRVKVSQTYDQSINNERIAPEILNAFKNNPYTQSLTSWA